MLLVQQDEVSDVVQVGFLYLATEMLEAGSLAHVVKKFERL